VFRSGIFSPLSFIQTYDKNVSCQPKNASLFSQIILHYQLAKNRTQKFTSPKHDFISPSPPPWDYSPLTPPSQAPTNAPPPASQQPQAQANCSSAPVTSPTHAEIPQHHLHLHRPPGETPHPRLPAQAQATSTPAASALDRTERRLRGKAGCFGLPRL
jgi:hypothetical protein